MPFICLLILLFCSTNKFDGRWQFCAAPLEIKAISIAKKIDDIRMTYTKKIQRRRQKRRTDAQKLKRVKKNGEEET